MKETDKQNTTVQVSKGLRKKMHKAKVLKGFDNLREWLEAKADEDLRAKGLK